MRLKWSLLIICAVILVSCLLHCESPGSKGYRLLIITPEKFLTQANRLAQHKNEGELPTRVVTVEYIADNSPFGDDLPEKIRTYIRKQYELLGIEYVLLAGGHEYIPGRYIYNPPMEYVEGAPTIATEPIFHSNSLDNNYTLTDWYYADLYSDWDMNNNHIFGETRLYNDVGKDEGGFCADVYVGRLPARGEDELNLMVEKVINFQPLELRKNSVCIFGSASDTSSNPSIDGYLLGKKYIGEICQDDIPYTFLSNHEGTLNYLQAMEELESGRYSLITIIGNGMPCGVCIDVSAYETFYGRLGEDQKRLASGYLGKFASDISVHNEGLLLTDSLIKSLWATISDDEKPLITCADVAHLNNHQPFVCIICASLCGKFDYSQPCLAEVLVTQEHGAVAVIALSRLSYYPQAISERALEKVGGGFLEAAEYIMVRLVDENQTLGEAFYEGKRDYVKLHPELTGTVAHQRNALFGYNLFGDPSLSIFSENTTER